MLNFLQRKSTAPAVCHFMNGGLIPVKKYADFNGQPHRVLKTWQAALYIRLSKEDMDKNKTESASIANQREILKEYLKLHPDITHADTYVDDGYSGTDFDRPGWARLMRDVNLRKINCVIVKDLARLGRNYTVSGDLIDNQFARLGVRFIALNNGIDTAGDGMNAATRCISIGVTNVINESYAASTSVNIRGTLNNHRKQGKFIGAFASYGYMKDPDDYHKLVTDKDCAPVVRMIYRDFIGGSSIAGIVKKLNGMGIPNPTLYKRQKGLNYNSRADNDGLWSDRTVRRILQNQMYIGNMVQGVNRTVNYKVHECRSVPREEWIVVENTHEPIIDRETFDKAQSLFKRNIHSCKADRKMDLFAGFVFCADCGKAMHKKVNTHTYGVYRYYKCSTKQKKSPGACTNHTIRIDRLEQAVLAYIRTMIDVALDYDAVAEQVKQNSRGKENDYIKRTLAVQKKEREKCLKASAELYPDWKSGVVTQEEYRRIRVNLNEKLKKLDAAIDNLEATQSQLNGESETLNSFAEHFMKHRNISELSRPVLVELIDKILIHEGGVITIKVKFADAFEALLNYMDKQEETA